MVLNELVQGVTDFLGWELRETDIQLTFQQGSSKCEVNADRIKIEQVLINLIRNSVEAIGKSAMGTGLSIGRSIVEAHNGKLWADKNRSRGAMFCMCLQGCR